MAMSLDLVGGSSYFWHWKHVVFHHTFVNVIGYDTDIDLAGLGRLTPHHRRAWIHRWQHLYVWFLYGVMCPARTRAPARRCRGSARRRATQPPRSRRA